MTTQNRGAKRRGAQRLDEVAHVKKELEDVGSVEAETNKEA